VYAPHPDAQPSKLGGDVIAPFPDAAGSSRPSTTFFYALQYLIHLRILQPRIFRSARVTDVKPALATRQRPSAPDFVTASCRPCLAWQSSTKVLARSSLHRLLRCKHGQKPHSTGSKERHEMLLGAISKVPCVGNLQLPNLRLVKSWHNGRRPIDAP
jgi:hypothetical protein